MMIPRRGAQVASITEKDLNDVLEVRIALENVAIEESLQADHGGRAGTALGGSQGI